MLAVYARPAATVSFDLSPEQPLRAAPPAPPETLAPLTSDSAPRRPQAPRNADLSVVAASQFREVQRSSKRLVWISSLASAAAASLLTFWLANQHHVPASRSAPLAAVSPAPALAPASAAAPSLPSEAAVSAAVPSEAPAASASPPVVVAVKPKPAHKPRAVSVVATPKSQHAETDSPTALRDPGAEPNPYDVKLEESAPAAKAAATGVARGSGIEADSKGSDASASSASTPGF